MGESAWLFPFSACSLGLLLVQPSPSAAEKAVSHNWIFETEAAQYFPLSTTSNGARPSLTGEWKGQDRTESVAMELSSDRFAERVSCVKENCKDLRNAIISFWCPFVFFLKLSHH